MRKLSKRESHDLAKGFKLLSDPTRLEILQQLANGPGRAGALSKAIRRRQATVFHHLARLRRGGLVTSVREGNAVVYNADRTNLKALGAAMAKLVPK